MKKTKKRKRYAMLLLILLLGFLTVQVCAQDTEEDAIAERKLKAAQLGLEDWVDEEGYLTDAFYEDKNDQILTDMGLDGLVRTLTEEELDAYVDWLNAGVSLYTVTRYEKVSQINPSTGNYLYTGIFEVDGYLAYCIERSATTPAKGASTGSWVAVTNDNLRKVLYYGYNGPAAKGYTYVETALAAGEANGDGDNSLGRTVLAEIKTYASPPSTFKVWKVETNGGSTQDLAFYTVVKNGYAKVKKTSGNTAISSGNANYSLKGAVYGIYSDSACSKKVGQVTTGTDGISGTLEVAPGTYYVKEITAPTGFELSTTVKKITVTSETTTTVTMTDVPKTVTPDLIIQKKDAETGETVPQPTGTFENAQFLVKFYAGNYGEGVNPESSGTEADRQWILKTDENGAVYFKTEYLVSGDSFWTDSSGKTVLPFGTITIQEIQAPEGYLLNAEVFVQKLSTSTKAFAVVEVAETLRKIQIQIQKINEKDQPLEEAEFTLYADQECTEEIAKGVTGNDGILVFEDLQCETYYYLKETRAPEGYRLNSNIYEIYSENADENNCISLEIVNESEKKLPNTGADGIGFWSVLGCLICLAGLRKKGGIE